MNAREMELIKFCEEQEVDEKISKKFRAANDKEALELNQHWIGKEGETFPIITGSHGL